MKEKKEKTKLYHIKTPYQERLVEKQQLGDLEHLISMNVGNFLVLLEEGNPDQIDQAKLKARNDLIKFGIEMQKLAEKIGGNCPVAVDKFLQSVDEILHSAAGWIDEAKIARCFSATQKLEKELRSA
jgi:hypothetical protein